MGGLKFREDMDEVRARLGIWWDGGDIGRPAMQLFAPRERPIEDVPHVPVPEGWTTGYSTKDFGYRVHLARRACVSTHYLAEAIPCVSPDLAPNCLALYLGCRGVEGRDTVWCEPVIPSLPDGAPEEFDFAHDPGNFYWGFSLRLGREQLEMGRGKFLIQFPDLIEGLDTLAAMRGTEELLLDLVERPAWVHACLRRITDLYFRHYDILYDMFRDPAGGSVFWAWAPGRMSKFQCDFSAMISPNMFGEFMVPVLAEMCERVSYCMYHLDGPGALGHLDHLISIPGLDMIQWTPGEGIEPVYHPRWWPYLHRIIDAGKSVHLHSCGGTEGLAALRREFGDKLGRFMICATVRTPEEADELMELAEV
jgi:5-methyltetrahydrofolate--homocysteine methyltransferase